MTKSNLRVWNLGLCVRMCDEIVENLKIYSKNLKELKEKGDVNIPISRESSTDFTEVDAFNTCRT